MLSCLIFKSISHFEFIFWYGMRVCPNFIDLHEAIKLSQNHLVKRLLFLLLCQRLIVHRHVGLLQALYSVPLIHMSVIVPIPCCFNYYSSVVLSEVSVAYAACFVLFLKISLAILSLLWFYINFKIICSNTVENVMGILIGIALSVNFSE